MINCKRCKKRPKTRLERSHARAYAPFCSYDCQEKYKQEEAQKYISKRRSENWS